MLLMFVCNLLFRVDCSTSLEKGAWHDVDLFPGLEGRW